MPLLRVKRFFSSKCAGETRLPASRLPLEQRVEIRIDLGEKDA